MYTGTGTTQNSIVCCESSSSSRQTSATASRRATSRCWRMSAVACSLSARYGALPPAEVHTGRAAVWLTRYATFSAGAWQAKEASATCVAETRKHDKESRVDPEADEVGKTEIDSDEMSDEETKSGGKKRSKHVKVRALRLPGCGVRRIVTSADLASIAQGKFAFRPFLRWWHEVGFIKACAQRRTLKDNMVRGGGDSSSLTPCSARAPTHAVWF